MITTFKVVSTVSLIMLGFLVGSFVTMWVDRNTVMTYSVHDIMVGPTTINVPWYWNLPLGSWCLFALLLMVIIFVCQALLLLQQASPRLSDGPVK